MQNNDLAQIASGASRHVINAIKNASARTGVNFSYMVQQAAAESSFDPKAKARGSSATGLYQFIESTWLNMVEKYGPNHGIDPNQPRKALLKLRNDPEVASTMAAEFAKENQDVLEDRWGGDVGPTELYFAHFMGAGGASAFLKAHDRNPMQKAAVLFPEAARANRNVFYDTSTGRAKTLDEVYAFFDNKFSDDGGAMVAAAEPDFGDDLDRAKSVIWTNGRKETITWNDSQDTKLSRIFMNEDETYGYKAKRLKRAAANPVPQYRLVSNPVDVMVMSKLDMPGGARNR